MKKLHILLLFVLASSMSLAQKNKLQAAYNYYKEPYKQYDKAKAAIDEASTNEQTSSWAKTWYYKGLIYSALYKDENFGSLCDNCLQTAFESFNKCNEIDPKNEWADEIKAIRIPYLMNQVFTQGVEYFKQQKFNEALSSFETVQEMFPGDTSAILNSAYSADRAGKYAKAVSYYQKLIDMKYKDDNVFLSLTNLYKQQNELDKALTVIQSGRQVFPDSLNLMLAEINILLSSGKNEAASQALDAAIAKDPDNPNLYLALGSTYDNLANPRDADGKELPKPANAAEFIQKAEAAYEKGLIISPDNYELNYNLGALYFNQAAEMANAANSIKSNDLYEKEKKKFEQKFRDAQPHLEKAMEKNPKASQDDLNLYEGTINSLKQLYVRIGEMEKYEKIKNSSAKD